MNIHKICDEGVAIEEFLRTFANELEIDLIGFWAVVSAGRHSYGLAGTDLREFVFMSVLALVSHGGVPMVPAEDGIHYWKAAVRYGTEPEKIAHAITCEWIDQGSPNPPVWTGLAFALQSWLDGPENRRDWPKPDVTRPG